MQSAFRMKVSLPSLGLQPLHFCLMRRGRRPPAMYRDFKNGCCRSSGRQAPHLISYKHSALPSQPDESFGTCSNQRRVLSELVRSGVLGIKHGTSDHPAN